MPTVQRSHGILFYISPRQNLHLHQTLKCYANCLDGFCLKKPPNDIHIDQDRTDNGILAFCDSTDDEVAFRLDGGKIPMEMNEEKKKQLILKPFGLSIKQVFVLFAAYFCKG